MCATVLCLTSDPILLLDFQMALKGAGLKVTSHPNSGGPIAAVIVDTDDLDPTRAPNPDCPMASKYPVIAITDTPTEAAAMKAAGWFAKPVITDAVADLVVKLVQDRKDRTLVLSRANAAD